MAILSTGPIENNQVSGESPTQQLTVKIENRDSVNNASIMIQGYYLNGTRTLYILETIIISPNEVVTKNYYANFSAFEFIFTTSGVAEDQIEMSVWGKKCFRATCNTSPYRIFRIARSNKYYRS